MENNIEKIYQEYIKQLESVVKELVDGNSVYDIIALTGCSEERAEEIYNLCIGTSK